MIKALMRTIKRILWMIYRQHCRQAKEQAELEAEILRRKRRCGELNLTMLISIAPHMEQANMGQIDAITGDTEHPAIIRKSRALRTLLFPS